MSLLDLLFPKKCLDCGRLGQYLCSVCLEKVPFAMPICVECQRFFPYGKTHTGCRKEFGLDGLISLWRYKGVIRKAIICLKYRFSTTVSQELSLAATNEIQKRLPS